MFVAQPEICEFAGGIFLRAPSGDYEGVIDGYFGSEGGKESGVILADGN
jgi:hypothetical protein